MMKRAVVLGARFGGLAVVAWLRRLYSPGHLEVTVIEQWQRMIYRPGLVDVFQSDPLSLMPRLTIPLAPYFKRRRVQLLTDTVVGIDPEKRHVIVASHAPVPYDVLFVATGMEPAWDAVSGLSRRHGGLCEGYLARRSGRLLHAEPHGRMVWAVGPLLGVDHWDPPATVGCECPVLESLFIWDRYLRQKHRRDQVELTVITPAARIAEMVGPRAREWVLTELDRRSIRLITGARYQQVTDRTVILSDQTVPYDHSVWIPPYRGPRWAQDTPLVDQGGWIPVSDHLQHPVFPDIYAVGDGISRSWPKQGHSAMVEARVAVTHWHAQQEKQKPPPPFRPLMLWVLETGGPFGMFHASTTFWGGSRDILWRGHWPVWVKHAFGWAYIRRHGDLPIMP